MQKIENTPRIYFLKVSKYTWRYQ